MRRGRCSSCEITGHPRPGMVFCDHSDCPAVVRDNPPQRLPQLPDDTALWERMRNGLGWPAPYETDRRFPKGTSGKCCSDEMSFGMSADMIEAGIAAHGQSVIAGHFLWETIIGTYRAMRKLEGPEFRPIAEAKKNRRLLIFGKMPAGHDEMAMAWWDAIDERWYYAPQGGLVQFEPTSWCAVPEKS